MILSEGTVCQFKLSSILEVNKQISLDCDISDYVLLYLFLCAAKWLAFLIAIPRLIKASMAYTLILIN